jgi:hypothetical protein
MRLRSALAARPPLSIAQTPGAAERRRLGTGWRRQLALFGAAYAVYNVARWVFAGDLAPAREQARWIVDLERDAVLALLWGPLVSLSVVATGNHYFFDIAAGLAVTAVGFAAGRLPLYLSRPGPTPIPGSATA